MTSPDFARLADVTAEQASMTALFATSLAELAAVFREAAENENPEPPAVLIVAGGRPSEN